MRDTATFILHKNTESGRLRAGKPLPGEVVIHIAFRQLFGTERYFVVVIEFRAQGGNPFEPPTHALAVGFDILYGSIGHGDEGCIPMTEVDVNAVIIIGPERATWAALLPVRPVHEVIHQKLPVAAKQVIECFPSA